MTQATTLGELKKTEWASPARRQRTVKDEMRENLICLLENGSPLFPGIVGYEETVLPQLVNAILSCHNFILLGLRGQAKSRILRQLITPLKDRIGSEITTHYPLTVELGAAITQQEAWIERNGGNRSIRIPDFMAELIERIAFEAREDKRVDRRSGVSQRLPISVLDNVLSNAERRSIIAKEKAVVPRISDVYAALPAITGKLELEYEGELQGSETIAKDLIRRAAGRTFEGRVGGANVDDIVHWFDEGGALKITPDERSEALLKGFTVVPGLLD